MPVPMIVGPRWSTSSFGGLAAASPLEASALGEHLGRCRAAHGRLFALRCVGEALHGFVAPRLVTTLVVAALLVAAVASMA